MDNLQIKVLDKYEKDDNSIIVKATDKNTNETIFLFEVPEDKELKFASKKSQFRVSGEYVSKVILEDGRELRESFPDMQDYSRYIFIFEGDDYNDEQDY
jgi:hypothetical protein